MHTNDQAADGLQTMRKHLLELGPEDFSIPAAQAESLMLGLRSALQRGVPAAVSALVDNSLEAGATTISIVIGRDGTDEDVRRPGQIAVVDNGHGMDPDGIRFACAWGGTPRLNGRSGFGRFGFGLPTACGAMGRRFEVHSRTEGGEWHAVQVDLDAIASGAMTREGRVFIPQAGRSTLPEWVREALTVEELEHGTAVVVTDLDWSGRTVPTIGQLRRELVGHLGLTFHAARGRAVLQVVDARSGKVRRVRSIDPLFLDEAATYHHAGPVLAVPLESKHLTLALEDSEGTRREGDVTVSASYLPIGFDKGHDGLRHEGRYNLMREHTGLIIRRHGRQIDVVKQAGDLTFGRRDRNWKVVLDFDPALDELFGITVDKEAVTLSEPLVAHLRDAGVLAMIKKLRRRHRRDLAASLKGVVESPEGPRESELVMKEAAELASGTEASVGACRVVHDPDAPGEPFFRFESVSGERRLVLSPAHRFYSDFYLHPKTSDHARTCIELLLFAWGEETLGSKGAEGQRLVERCSKRLAQLLGVLGGEHPGESVATEADS